MTLNSTNMMKELIKVMSKLRKYSVLASADITELYEFLRDYKLKCSVTIKLLNGFLVPDLSIHIRVSPDDISDIAELINLLDNKFHWRFSSGAIYNSDSYDIDLSKTKFTQYSDLKELASNIKSNKLIVISIRPTLLNNSGFDKDALIDDYKLKDPIYLFHITDRSNLKSIMTSGLLPKSSTIGYFKYENLIHLLRSLNGDIVRLVNNKLVPNPRLLIKNPELLMVGPINNLSNVFYLDPASPLDGLVTNSGIDPIYLKIVNQSDYKDLFKKYDISIPKFRFQAEQLNPLDGVTYDKSSRLLRTFSIKYDMDLSPNINESQKIKNQLKNLKY